MRKGTELLPVLCHSSLTRNKLLLTNTSKLYDRGEEGFPLEGSASTPLPGNVWWCKKRRFPLEHPRSPNPYSVTFPRDTERRGST